MTYPQYKGKPDFNSMKEWFRSLPEGTKDVCITYDLWSEIQQSIPPFDRGFEGEWDGVTIYRI